MEKDNLYLKLFFQYVDALLSKQVTNLDSGFNGGFLCESCKNIHGRSIDTIYALMIAYKITKDKKYINALELLFKYSKNLLTTDGALYNDLQTEWRYTTTFFEIALIDTLNVGKEFLPKALAKEMENRALVHAEWLYQNLDEHSPANINYCTTNGLALLLAGKYFNNKIYLDRAKRLVEYALGHISSNNLFYGEGKPHNAKSKHGCFAIDIGYNLEESLPSLAKYAFVSGDNEIYQKVLRLAYGHLPFILPDGAIDNSFGVRNYKWTYYGSRTCDGVTPLFLIFAKEDKRFVKASKLNLELIDRCTHDGLLFGGPDYFKHDEKPCLHQTFEHVNALAFVIDNFPNECNEEVDVLIPSQVCFDTYLREMDSYRLSNNRYILDISNNDVNIAYSGHASGGAITLLFDKKNNYPLIAGSVGDYQLTESTNMQVPLDRVNHKPLLPRIEMIINNVLYSSVYCVTSKIKKDGSSFSFAFNLTNRNGQKLKQKFLCRYLFSDNGLEISISSNKDFTYKLPLIHGEIQVEQGKILSEEKAFFLTPGFESTEYQISSINNTLKIGVK